MTPDAARDLRARARQHSRWAGGVLLVAATLVGCTDERAPTPEPSGPATSSGSSTPDAAASLPTAPTGTEWLSRPRSGQMLAVPASWSYTRLRCGSVPPFPGRSGAYHFLRDLDRCVTPFRRPPPPSVGLVSSPGVAAQELVCDPRCYQTVVVGDLAVVLRDFATAEDLEVLLDTLQPVPDSFVAVPSVSGRPLADAVPRLEDAGLTVDYDRQPPQPADDLGVTAFTTEPRPGAVVREGSTVLVKVRVSIID